MHLDHEVIRPILENAVSYGWLRPEVLDWEDAMPAKSVKMRRAAAIAEHHPGKLYKRNRGLKKMSHGQLHEFASTREKKLPQRAGKGVYVR